MLLETEIETELEKERIKSQTRGQTVREFYLLSIILCSPRYFPLWMQDLGADAVGGASASEEE